MSAINKPVNQKAWFLILPVIVCVAFSAIIPLMTVVNYSVQDIISPERRIFVGTEWFVSVMRDEDLHGAMLRQLIFSLASSVSLRSTTYLAIPAASAWCTTHDFSGISGNSDLLLLGKSLTFRRTFQCAGMIWMGL